MKPPRPTYLTGSRSKKGFALLITITLLAFLVLLLVSLASLTRVETQVANNNQQLSSARQNAMMALNIAIGQLQKEAGTDQRVTARAEILDTASTQLRNTVVQQPLWTGVWKTGSASLDIANSGTPQRQTSFGAATPTVAQKVSSAAWLVSNPTPATPVDPTSYAGTSTGTTPNAVDLATNVGPNQNITVTVPLVDIQATPSGFTSAQTIGRYGYWISDEGVKAKTNLVDPTLGVNPSSDPSRNQLHFLAPQAAAAFKASTDFNSIDIRADAGLSKVLTMGGLPFLSGLSGLSVRKLSPDITTYGSGVLADVRRGGLKKDLTTVLETPATFNTFSSNATYGYGTQMLYRTASSAGLVVPAPPGSSPFYESVNQTGSNPAVDGVSWFSLYSHYNAYKGVMTAPTGLGAGGSAPTSSGDVSAAPNVASPRVYSLSGPVRTGSLLPTAIAFRLDIALSSYRDAASGNWKLRLHYFPQLVLHNPHSVRLSLAGFQFQRNIGAFGTAGSYNPTNPSVTCIQITSTTGGSPTTIPYFRVNQAPSSAAGRFTLRTKAGDCDSLEPGETRVFALDNDNATFATPAAAITFTDLVSNPGMSADYSQQCDVLTGADATTGFSTGAAYSTADPATMISVALATARLRMQNIDTFVIPNTRRWPQSDGTRISTGGGSSDLAAAAGSWTTLRIDQLTSPRRIIGFYIRQKGFRPTSSSYSYSNATNNVPLYMGNFTGLSPVDDNSSYVWREIYLSPFGGLYQNSQTDVNIFPNGNHWETSFGETSVGAGGSPTRYILRDMPNQPLVSLGQFMHMSATRYPNATGDYSVFGTGSMFVGGSCASPAIPTDYNALGLTVGTTGSGASATPQRTIYTDDSYLANEALFDRFFLSTVPPQTINAAGTSYPATWTAFNTANPRSSATSRLSDSTKPLLNSRLKPYASQEQPPLMDDLRDMDKAAANLLLDGAFNINSTSVAAWKAFLGGLSGNDIRLFNAGSGSSSTESTTIAGIKGVAFSRFWSASGKTSANTLWSGLRVLSDNELDDLASKIVTEVKLRGPFLSLADFLNRRLGSNSDALARCGALQAAIDKTSPDINATAKSAIPGVVVNATIPTENPTNPRAPNLILGNMKDANGNAWSPTLGVPGYLMQQDIVQAIAPAITVRSDTFVIRTYGEVINPATSQTQGKAWLEAVVQRLPEYVDASMSAETDIASAAASSAKTTNQTFGRRFKIVGFRWLSSNDL